MKFCMKCGGSLEKTFDNSWVWYNYCYNCDVTFKVVQPDHMSGNHNIEIITLEGRVDND
jgi:hypothetical protein